MSQSHYVLDLYYYNDDRPNNLRREVVRIAAKNDEQALAEGLRVAGWKKADRYDIRSIRTAERANDRLVHASTPSAALIAARSTIFVDRNGTASRP